MGYFFDPEQWRHIVEIDQTTRANFSLTRELPNGDIETQRHFACDESLPIVELTDDEIAYYRETFPIQVTRGGNYRRFRSPHRQSAGVPQQEGQQAVGEHEPADLGNLAVSEGVEQKPDEGDKRG